MADIAPAAIEAARAAWSLRDCSVSMVAARENHVYRVSMPGGDLALRIHRAGYRTISQIRSELEWMAMLNRGGVLVPRPVPTNDGELVHAVGGTVLSALRWVPGLPLSCASITPALYESLGGVLARTHALADQWMPPDSFCRPDWNLVGDNPSWGRFWENPGLSDQQAGFFAAFRDTARNELTQRMRTNADYGLIHADLVPDNVLVHDSGIFLIDFDDGGFGDRLFDLATITQSVRRRFGREDLAEAAVAGYGRYRPVNASRLLLFEALRSCSYVGWNIARIDEADGHDRNGRFISEAERTVRRFLDC